MVWNYEKDIYNKARDIFFKNGFNPSGTSIATDTGSVVIDMVMEKEKEAFLVEINNGTRVNMDDISDLKIAQDNYPKPRFKFIPIILTESIESVDSNITRVAKREKIKIFDIKELEKEVTKKR